MIPVVVDFETYYDKEYSLSRMTMEEYLNDSRFEIIGASIAVGHRDPIWRSYGTLEDYARWLAPLNGALVAAHNALFDGAILGWRLGIRPKTLLCTLSMSRAADGTHVSNSLANCAQRLGLPPKGTEVAAALGKRRADFTPEELVRYGEYCRHDVELCRELVRHYAKIIPAAEMAKMDVILRTYTQPVLCLDREKLTRECDIEERRKRELLARLNGPAAGDVSSNDKFAALLLSLGVTPPRKLSVKKKNPDGSPALVYAFAKSDADFVALQGHEDPAVVAAVEARLKIKSTLRMTRAIRMVGIHDRNGGKFPVPLAPAAAHTLRLGGTDKVNALNFPRAVKGEPDSGLLRKAIIAPEGHVLVVGDLSQIEARLLNWQANARDKLQAFAAGRDVYSEQASVIFSRHVDRKKNPDDFVAGFIGKAVTLGCGYGLGHGKFALMIHTGMLGMRGILFDVPFARALGVDFEAYAVFLRDDPPTAKRLGALRPSALTAEQWFVHLACAKKIIDVFRESNPAITAYWGACKQAVTAMSQGYPYAFGHNAMVTEPMAIRLPNGMRLKYPDLGMNSDNQWTCLRRKEGRTKRVRVYGGVIAENCCQALAAVIIGDAMLAIDREGWRVVLQVHDEIVTVVPERDAQDAARRIKAILCTPPAWAPGLPIDADVGFGRSYGETK